MAESICNEVLLSGGAVTVVGGVPEDDVINVAGPIDEIVGKLKSVFQIIGGEVPLEGEEEVVAGRIGGGDCAGCRQGGVVSEGVRVSKGIFEKSGSAVIVEVGVRGTGEVGGVSGAGLRTLGRQFVPTVWSGLVRGATRPRPKPSPSTTGKPPSESAKSVSNKHFPPASNKSAASGSMPKTPVPNSQKSRGSSNFPTSRPIFSLAPEGHLCFPFVIMNRRSLLRASALSSVFAGTAQTLSALAADNAYRANIGLQLYTLRNELKADTTGTIKALVAAGYKQGEMYGFPNCDDMIKAANDHGLGLHSTHFEWETVVNPLDEGFSDFKKILEKANKIKLTHLVVPYLHDKDRKTLDDYKRVAGNLNKAAVIAKKAGIQLAYHNHSFEYEPMDGSTGFEVFVKEFAPEMKFELDVFWVKAGGIDPVTLIKKLNGRVSQLHLKDLKKGLDLPIYNGMPKEAFKELGNGMISMEPIIKAGKAAGVAHCHVEQDQSLNPLASIKESIAYLKGL